MTFPHQPPAVYLYLSSGGKSEIISDYTSIDLTEAVGFEDSTLKVVLPDAPTLPLARMSALVNIDGAPSELYRVVKARQNPFTGRTQLAAKRSTNDGNLTRAWYNALRSNLAANVTATFPYVDWHLRLLGDLSIPQASFADLVLPPTGPLPSYADVRGRLKRYGLYAHANGHVRSLLAADTVIDVSRVVGEVEYDYVNLDDQYGDGWDAPIGYTAKVNEAGKIAFFSGQVANAAPARRDLPETFASETVARVAIEAGILRRLLDYALVKFTVPYGSLGGVAAGDYLRYGSEYWVAVQVSHRFGPDGFKTAVVGQVITDRVRNIPNRQGDAEWWSGAVPDDADLTPQKPKRYVPEVVTVRLSVAPYAVRAGGSVGDLTVIARASRPVSQAVSVNVSIGGVAQTGAVTINAGRVQGQATYQYQPPVPSGQVAVTGVHANPPEGEDAYAVSAATLYVGNLAYGDFIGSVSPTDLYLGVDDGGDRYYQAFTLTVTIQHSIDIPLRVAYSLNRPQDDTQLGWLVDFIGPEVVTVAVPAGAVVGRADFTLLPTRRAEAGRTLALVPFEVGGEALAYDQSLAVSITSVSGQPPH